MVENDKEDSVEENYDQTWRQGATQVWDEGKKKKVHLTGAKEDSRACLNFSISTWKKETETKQTTNEC